MFKFQTLGAIKSAVNNPRVRATAVTKNGYAFKITDNYTSGGSKSSVAITIAGTTPADGNISFFIGGKNVYTTIVGATQTTAALVAAEIKASLDAVLLGHGYTVARADAVITVTAPTNSSDTTSVAVTNVSMGTSACTLAPVVTAGTDAANNAEAGVPFTNDADAKITDIWVAWNRIDTPELDNSADYQVPAGGYVNGFKLANLAGLKVEMTSDLVTDAYAGVNKGDKLVPVPAGSGAMKWKVDAAADYECFLVVTDKTTFGGQGYECKIATQIPA